MTIATDMGFEVGNLYRVIDGYDSSYYKNGMIVKFQEDDDSSAPWFVYASGPIGERFRYKPQQRIAIPLDRLEPVETQDTHETSTNKHLLILYIQQQYPNDKMLKALVESL